LPSLIITVILWFLVGFLIYFVDPSFPLAIPGFFLLVFFTLLFTFAAIFAHSRRGLLTAFGITIFLILRFYGIGHILNFVLILALILCIELYFSRKN
jgi:hypothetical protein